MGSANEVRNAVNRDQNIIEMRVSIISIMGGAACGGMHHVPEMALSCFGWSVIERLEEHCTGRLR